MAGSLITFVVRRTAAALTVLVGASLCCFLTFHVLRPDMFDGRGSFGSQLWDFLDRTFVHADLGRSWTIGHRRVTEMVLEGLPADISLLAGGIVIGTLAGIAGGAVCAVRPKSLVARGLGLFAAVAVCAPVYWIGLVAIFLFSPDIGTLGLPFVGGQGTYKPLTADPLHWLQGLILPWLVLAAPLAAMCLRMMRKTMVDALDADYLRTALGKGLRWRTAIRRHAVPAGASPVIALVGVTMAAVVTNAILIERTFNIPGVLRLTTVATGSIEGKGVVDYPVLQGIVVTGALMVVVASLLTDVALAWLDPRVRT